MEWPQYLREERARKQQGLALLTAGKLSMSETQNGQQIDTSAVTLARIKQDIADIEAILTNAGEQLDV